ncbi:MAG: hypothetical protein HC856_06470 [Pseudanabaena sp. RU_4_16]|nr:hypothetical protein [Pseudanabaena sp. RU_4_16]
MSVERWTDETLDRFAATVATAIAANSDLIRVNTEAIAASNERLARIEQIQATNAEHISRIDEQIDDLTAVTQAIGRDVAHLVATQQAAEQERAEFRQVMIRFADTEEGVVRLLANLDSDRPTILRKLNAIENKVDRLLEQQ